MSIPGISFSYFENSIIWFPTNSVSHHQHRKVIAISLRISLLGTVFRLCIMVCSCLHSQTAHTDCNKTFLLYLHATTGDHVISVTADFQACIEDVTVLQIVRQRTLVATAALTLAQYGTFTAALKFCLRLLSPWTSWIMMMMTITSFSRWSTRIVGSSQPRVFADCVCYWSLLLCAWVRDRVCSHDILQTACGDFIKFTVRCTWRQRWTNYILRSKGQGHSSQVTGHFGRHILQPACGNFTIFTT